MLLLITKHLRPHTPPSCERRVNGVRNFSWQTGYGAFSVSPSLVEKTRRYIRNQETHHRAKSFQQEYVDFLEASGVEYDPEYLW